MNDCAGTVPGSVTGTGVNVTDPDNDTLSYTVAGGPTQGILDLNTWWQVSEEFSVNAGLFNLTDKQYWQWGDVRGLSAQEPALNINRYTQPGRHAAVNLIWEI